jgi:hypothetical protein
VCFGFCFLAASVLAAAPSVDLAQSVDLARSFLKEPVQAPPPLQLAAGAAPAPAGRLGAASENARDQLDALILWNRQRHEPVQNGFARLLAAPVAVRLPQDLAAPPARKPFAGGYLAAAPGGGLAWGAVVQVDAAYRLRLHLADVSLPAEARMWVYGRSDKPVEFGPGLRGPQGDLWTPSVAGDRLYFEIQLGPGAARGDATFTFDQVLEIVRLGDASVPAMSAVIRPEVNTGCLVDASCVTAADWAPIDTVRRGIAQLFFIVNGQGFVCTGGLLNDKAGDFIPYLLTANHCISSQATAGTLDAFWDYFTPSCGGPFPDESQLPRSVGAALLATGARPGASDFAFLRLNSAPAGSGGRAFLGWNAIPGVIAQGTYLYRVSHPVPEGTILPQGFSVTTVNTSPGACGGGLPQPTFIYSQAYLGDVFGGSSGSPSMLANGQVVGQLFGACGPTAGNYPGCDASDAIVDGSFAATFPFVSTWLLSPPQTCKANANTACLLGNRFKATVRFRSDFSDNPANSDALVKSVSGFANPNFETAFFYFNDSNNIELMLKMLDQGNTNGQGQLTIAVLFGSATPLRLELTLTDTKTNAVRTYASSAGTLAGGVDFTAFVK